MKIDLIIEDGTVVTPTGVIKTDIAIEDGKISAIGSRSVFPEAEKTIKVEGKIVIPGGIDPHSHYEVSFMGETVPETWDEGTIAAAIGGTTMTIDFALQQKGKPLMGIIKQQLSRAEKLAAIDYSTHGVFLDFTDLDKVLAEMKEIVDFGISSFKEFTIYRKAGWYADDWGILTVLKGSKQYNALVGVHAENVFIGEDWQQECLRKGEVQPKYHAIAKPNFVEVEAIQRVLSIAEFAGSRIYIAHMSTREGVELVGNARRKGLPVYAETCPHYLTLTDDILETANGLYSICSPPFRKKEDNDALWQGLADGRVSVVGSDHVPYTTEQKKKHSANFAEVPNGCPGSETRVPLIFAEGVGKGRLSLSRFVEVVSTNVAKMYGVYPKKGIISPGSDADIVIIDPKKEKSLNKGDLHMGTDWSLFEGFKIKGWPIMTILRGKVIVENENYLGTPGEGDFVKGKIEEDIISTV